MLRFLVVRLQAILISSCDDISHILAVLSKLAVTTLVPTGLNSAERNESSWCNFDGSWPELASQICRAIYYIFIQTVLRYSKLS